ncbi:MAG: hypothetical protein GY711_17475 [bacterium]|nr:hypothetical protein [bacterium]
MNSLSTFRRATLLPALSCLTLPAFAQDPAAPEVAVPCVDGPLPLTLCYGEWADCAIDFSSDLDTFRFLGKAGDTVNIVVSGVSLCLDPHLVVRDPSNATILDEFCEVGCNTSCTLDQTLVLPADGSYTLLVRDWGNTEVGSYVLSIEKLLPDYPTKSLTYANPLEEIEIDHRGDQDFVTFEGLAGSEVLMQVTGLDLCIDPEVIVYEPSGAILQQNACNIGCNTSCSYPLNFLSLPATGTYVVQVQDEFRTETGTIGVSVQCIFSPDPSGLCPQSYTNNPIGTSFCTSNANSTGSAATLAATGSASVGENRVHLTASDAPAGQFGIFFTGMNQTSAPHPALPAPSQGLLCVGLPFHRFGVIQSCWTGQFGMRVDLDALPPGMPPITSGATWNFQLWYRDGALSNTSDGLAITFQP